MNTKPRIRSFVTTSSASLVTTMLSAAPVAAQEIAPEELRARAVQEKKLEEGWQLKLNLGLSGSFNHSSQVVGADDGSTFQIGALLDGTSLFVSGAHEWESNLLLQHGQTKTPSIDRLIKSVDNLELKSMYFFHFEEPNWIGPFAGVRFQTQILDGYSVQVGAKKAVLTSRDGSTTTQDFAAQEKIPLTSAFEPVVLRESAGMFANPFTEKSFTLKSKLGVGGQHVLTGDGFVIADDGATPDLELKQLSSVHELGFEFDVALNGELVTDVLTWKLGTNLFMPIVTSGEGDLALNVTIGGGVSAKLSKWLSVDYILSVKRVPLVLDAFQVQNGVVLTAGFSIL